MTNQDPIAALGGIEKARIHIIEWRSDWTGDSKMAEECRAALGDDHE